MGPTSGVRYDEVMATLQHDATGLRHPLTARHLIGRSPQARLCLRHSAVSAEHALVYWTQGGWEARDLGSRNGTRIDGQALRPGHRLRLRAGMVLEFGASAERWCLLDEEAPVALAWPVDVLEESAPGGTRGAGEKDDVAARVRRGQHDLLVLPDEGQPELTVYRAAPMDDGGDWRLERDGESVQVRDGATVTVGGRTYALYLPETLPVTGDVVTPQRTLDQLVACFRVSRDEEFVTLRLEAGREAMDLGARAHHLLLLTLARARLRDQEQALIETSQGWMYQDELTSGLGMDEMHLNVTVYRCRQHVAAAGVLGAAGIIERRRPTRQLRFGIGEIRIETV
jgi:pSer/pThr/pTyr-binding forkhead associated (FHA) protein